MQPTSLAVTSTAPGAVAPEASAAPALTLAADTRSVRLPLLPALGEGDMRTGLVGIVVVCTLASCTVALAARATTEDGGVVELHDDGTWEYAETPEPTPSGGFRQASWGDSPEQVRASEKAKYEPAMSSEGMEAYSTTVLGIDAYVGYFFVNEKLCRARYLFADKHTNENSYIVDYRNVKKELTNKYGAPGEDETLWLDDLYQDDFSEWGFAVSLGHLVYFSTWETGEAEIRLLLSGDNYDITLACEYMSKALKDEEQRQKKEAAASDF